MYCAAKDYEKFKSLSSESRINNCKWRKIHLKETVWDCSRRKNTYLNANGL